MTVPHGFYPGPEEGRFARIAAAVERAQDITGTTHGTGTAAEKRNVSWMPFPLFRFIALLGEAAPWIPREKDVPPRFLEIGAGPGPYLVIARDMFGLDARGYEINDELAHPARMQGLDVATADAATWTGYTGYACIWFNRALRERGPQLDLERRIWDDMAPDAVVICANLESPPPSTAFFPVLDDWADLRCGIWVKIAGRDA